MVGKRLPPASSSLFALAIVAFLSGWIEAASDVHLRDSIHSSRLSQSLLLVEASNNQLKLEKVFHILGVPGVKRNQRVDVIFNAKGLVVRQGKTDRLTLVYFVMRRLVVLNGTRTYAKATYAAVLAGGIGGALLITKKQRVDTLVLDYVNDRGGQMALILQVPTGQGEACSDWLRRFGIAVEEPEPLPPAPNGTFPR